MKFLTIIFTLSSTLIAGEFDGTWKTNCASEGATNLRSTVIVQAAQGALEQMQYKDNQCITPTVLVQASGAIEFPALDAQTRFDLTYAAFTVTIKDAATVKVANLVEYCGVSNWQLDIPMDVAGKTCSEQLSFPRIGDKHHNIIALNEKGQLLLGRLTVELDGTSPELRPTQLDTQYPFIKQ